MPPAARQKRPRQNEPSQTMSLILCARFFLSTQRRCRRVVLVNGLRRPYLFRLAGKDREERGDGYIWYILHLNLGNKQIC